MTVAQLISELRNQDPNMRVAVVIYDQHSADETKELASDVSKFTYSGETFIGIVGRSS